MKNEKKGIQNRRPNGKTNYGHNQEDMEEDLKKKVTRKIVDSAGDYTLVYPIRQHLTRDYVSKQQSYSELLEFADSLWQKQTGVGGPSASQIAIQRMKEKEQKEKEKKEKEEEKKQKDLKQKRQELFKEKQKAKYSGVQSSYSRQALTANNDALEAEKRRVAEFK